MNSYGSMHLERRQLIKTTRLILQRCLGAKIKAKANERTKSRTKEKRDISLAYSKQYYQENKEKFSAYAKVKHNCGCGGRYSGGGKSKHEMSKKHTKWVAEQDQ